MQTFGGATPLMYACQQCKEDQVLDILTKQPYAVKDRDRTLKTPLHYCAENPNTSCAETVLKFAPELVNAQDENGYCTLHLAVIAGNKSLIKLLIAKGADVNIYDNEGHSSVHWAIVSSEKEALEMIIRAGANPSTPDIHGGYPLHYAVQMCGSNSDYVRNFEDTIRVVETLLNFGVDVNVKDKDGRQPILWAASAGSADAVIHLVSGGACVEAADKDGLTALHCAASRGHTTTLDTLITLCGTHVDVIDGNGCSALFYSVTLGHADATEVLLQLGAEPNRQDRKGRTPAHCGAAKGQLETLRVLLKHGGNLWLRNVKGDLPLHEAVASGRKDLVLWLLSQNPDAVNIANNDGRCPLHIAAMYNNTEMVKILIDAKSLVNPVMRTSKGVLMTPLNVALCKGHRSCGKYLQLHGGVPFSKVAKIEPASAFAFRVSPSAEIMNNSPEINVDTLPISKTISNTSTDIQVIKTETTDKKKVYRRRKKRRTNKDFQESDSDDNIQSIKTKTPENRKNGQEGNREDEEIDEESDEDVEKIRFKKVQLNNGKNEKNGEAKASKTNSVNIKSGKTPNDDVAVQETIAVKRVAKSKTDPKPLPRTKSLKESKNVNNLSPDDFPPLMQTVNQLDTVIIEPEIDVNKSPAEYDTEHGLRTPIPPVAKLSTTEQTDLVEKKEELIKTETQRSEETPTNKKIEENKILKDSEQKKSEKNGKETPHKDEKSEKEETPKMSVKESEKTETKSPADEGSTQKNEKSIKSKNSGDGDKKKEKTSKSDTQKVSTSNGHDKSKKSASPKGLKSVASTPTSEKKTEMTDVKISEKPPERNEENASASLETKVVEASVTEKHDPEPSISPSDENKEEKREIVPEAESEKTPAKIEPIAEVHRKEEPKLDDKTPDEKPPIVVDENLIEKDNSQQQTTESVPIQETEGVKSPELQTVEEKMLKEEKAPQKEDNPPVLVLAEAPKQEPKNEVGQTTVVNTTTETPPLDIPPEISITHVMTAEPLQDDVHLDTPVTSEQESLPVEEPKLSETEPTVKANSPETPETHAGDGNTLTEVSLPDSPVEVRPPETGIREYPEPEDIEDRRNSNEANIPNNNEDSTENSRKESIDSAEQRQYKPAKVQRLCRRHKDFKDDVNQASVTQLVQSTIRKYHMERGIFYQLLELKRYQIRSGKANEQVLVKRLADEYERSRIFLGMKPYTGLYKFREFEKFLYDQLKALNNRRSFIVPEIKSYDDIDALSGFLKKSRYKIISEIPQPEMVCTCITQRCHHSACAYTSVPCSAYIADLRHHKHHRKRKECFFPRIDQTKSENAKHGERPATLELIQGSQKHVITLPQSFPDKNKRYYVTFTIKGVTSPKEEDLMDGFKHRHAKSV